ncbi:helix-turn-helix domain-containing protein [Aquisalimonas lutea]|uniref:helix-turn-helix domain-containing protein n=1 Tax=Aquisalimonas lutea TaxID=1327750 RepID=UPI0025B34EBE|nr:helix-turn-helix domain-containing protein [Aquisalimonas lutea]MDN3518233.1 helix-turn-helix domain-containing protein [Aquisalimonas lutea]
MVKSIRAVARGLAILEVLAEADSLSLQEIQGYTGLAKATTLRLLVTLTEQGWVYRGLGDGRYRLRAELTIRTRVPASFERMGEIAGPLLAGIQKQTGWPSDIAVREDNRMRILETSRGVSFVLNYRVVGFRPHMLWSALGRAYLAYCPSDEREELVARLSRSEDKQDRTAGLTGWVDKLVASIRNQGYAHREPGYWGHAAPVPEAPLAIAVPVMRDGRVLATINIVWPPAAMTVATAASQYLGLLLETAEALGERL